MSAVTTLVDLLAQKHQARTMLERRVAEVNPAVQWHYSAQSNEHFPLRLYASAKGTGYLSAAGPLVIAVEVFNPIDEQGDRLIVSADIMDDDGVIVAEGPRYTVPIPAEPQLLNDPGTEITAVTQQVRVALQKLDEWLEGETSTIRAALAS